MGCSCFFISTNYEMIFEEQNVKFVWLDFVSVFRCSCRSRMRDNLQRDEAETQTPLHHLRFGQGPQNDRSSKVGRAR